MCVILCTCAVSVTSVYQMCLLLFLASSERGVSLRMREAYPSAELPMCGGEPLCC
jgi:hypothetical protein